MIVAVVSCLSLGCDPPDATVDLVIENVNVVDTDAKEVLAGRDVWISGDRIERVAHHGAPGARALHRFDARGGYAIAGLYDAHVHVDTAARLALMLPELYGCPIDDSAIDDDLAAYMAYGVTGVVVLGGNDSVLAARERSRAAGRFLPRVVAASPILDGPRSDNPVHLKVSGIREATAAVNAAADEGYQLIKVYNDLDLETRNAIIRTAGERGLPVVGHLPPSLTLEQTIVPGFANVAHAEEITRTWDGEDPKYLESAVQLLAERGVSLTPNLVAYREITGQLGGIDTHLEGKDWPLTPPLARIYSQPPFNGYLEDFGGDDIRERAIDYFTRMSKAMDWITARSRDAGVLILAGSDTGNPTMYPGQSLYRELDLLREAGLDPYEVIGAATTNVARLLGEADARGSIRPGHVADMVIFAANPLDQRVLDRHGVSAVVRDGTLFDRARVDAEVQRLSGAYDRRESAYRRALRDQTCS